MGKLIYLYDSNDICIDGPTSLSFSEDVAARFTAYGWQVETIDGHDVLAVEIALEAAIAETERPSLIVAKTHIGYGSPNCQDKAKAHGSPLGEEEIRLTKEGYGWPAEPSFHVPEEVRTRFQEHASEGAAQECEWREMLVRYAQAHPELASSFQSALAGEMPEGWDAGLGDFSTEKPLATRVASGSVLDKLAQRIPTLIGGSADLTPSNNTLPKGEQSLSRDNYAGRYIRFGVREHGMGGILNGLSLHGGLFPYGGTFLVFSDYMRPSIRLAALMHRPVIFVFTHDSVCLGEDGPTHQPIEHLASLRAMPNLTVIRPADATETAEAWKVALSQCDRPTALCLTRQSLPVLDRSVFPPATGLAQGGYVLLDNTDPAVILIGTGSEVHIALAAAKALTTKGIATRVVSLPSFDLFDRQPRAYRDTVLPPSVTCRVAIEAGTRFGWERYVGDRGAVVGLDRFGASAPYEIVLEKLGLTADAVVKTVSRLLAASNSGSKGERKVKTR